MGFWKGFLLDFDGTLVVTESLAALAMEKVLQECGVVDTHSLAPLLHGRTWNAGIGDLLRKFPELKSMDLQRRLREVYKEERKNGGVSFVPGALEALRLLRTFGCPVALVTGSDQEEVLDIMGADAVHQYFDLVVTASDGLASKPSPAQYQKALKHFGLSPSEALVFEDSHAGIESAMQAGVAFVHVRHVSPLPEPHPAALGAMQDWTRVNRAFFEALYQLHGKHFPLKE
jgi:beta-phosphoglucomutase